MLRALRSRFFRHGFGVGAACRATARKLWTAVAEALEARRFLTCTHNFNAGTGALTVTGTSSADSITITKDAGTGKVRVSCLTTPVTTVAPGDVQSFEVNGDAGADTINLQGVLAADFNHSNLILITIKGGAGNDTVTGSELNDTILGEADNDVLSGGPAMDKPNGGEGNDILHGNDGPDCITGGNGDDNLFGDAGTDNLYGNDGVDYLYGGDDVDYIEAGAGHDSAYGGDGDDQIHGQGGNDTLFGEAGSDALFGGTENDVYVIPYPNNEGSFTEAITENSSEGTDTIDFSGYGGAVAFGVGTAVTQNFSGPYYIDLNADNTVENIIGSAYNDTLSGNDLINDIRGGAGNDSLSGGGEDDVLYGDAGTDTGVGGAGSDTPTDIENWTE